MAHPPDPALSKAIGDALRSLRQRGWSTRDIAAKLGVADPTVTRWENGNRLPAIDMLPRIDTLCDKPRGYVLRLAGYVDDTADTLTAIATDQRLDDDGRSAMRSLYHVLTRGDTRPIPDPADPDEMEIWSKTSYSEAERRRLIIEGLREPRTRPRSKRRAKRPAS